MSKAKWYTRPIYVMLALALVVSLGVVAVPMAGTVEANGTNYYVSTSGNNTDTGVDWAHAWRDIQYAVDNVSPGDTIHVAPGTYTETGGPFYTDHYGLKFDGSQGGITLSGANAGIPGTGTRGPESIIEGQNR